MSNVLDSTYFKYEGRIVKKNNSAYLGFTNSTVTFQVNCLTSTNKITAILGSSFDEQKNYPRLKLFIDNTDMNTIFIMDRESQSITVTTNLSAGTHTIRLHKITEAKMSHVRFDNVILESCQLIPHEIASDSRTKIEFIGDSITCGYGVYGEPDSDFHICEEDGTQTYAYLAAQELNLNARYTAVSGFGVYTQYDGDLNGVLPKIYPYTNYFVDSTIEYDFNEFIPNIIVINLGTNDAKWLDKPMYKENFIPAYVTFLFYIRSKYPDAKLLLLGGTLCEFLYPYIEDVVKCAKAHGMKNIDSYELPFHDVAQDGIASGHPTIATHKKDANRLIEKLKEILA